MILYPSYTVIDKKFMTLSRKQIQVSPRSVFLLHKRPKSLSMLYADKNQIRAVRA